MRFVLYIIIVVSFLALICCLIYYLVFNLFCSHLGQFSLSKRFSISLNITNILFFPHISSLSVILHLALSLSTCCVVLLCPGCPETTAHNSQVCQQQHGRTSMFLFSTSKITWSGSHKSLFLNESRLEPKI